MTSRDVLEDELAAAIAASSTDERADARELLDLAQSLLFDRRDLIRLRTAFLAADASDDVEPAWQRVERERKARG